MSEKYPPAPSTGTPDASQADLVTPSLRRRMACWLYEGMLLFAVVFIAGWLFSTLGQMRDAMDARRPLLQAFLFLVFGIYFTWFWSRGQTLAMKTWHIRVVDRLGRPVSQARALARYVLAWVWFLPGLGISQLAGLKGGGPVTGALLAWVLVYAALSRLHPDRQFLHDAICRTRVITWYPPHRAPKATAR